MTIFPGSFYLLLEIESQLKHILFCSCFSLSSAKNWDGLSFSSWFLLYLDLEPKGSMKVNNTAHTVRSLGREADSSMRVTHVGFSWKERGKPFSRPQHYSTLPCSATLIPPILGQYILGLGSRLTWAALEAFTKSSVPAPSY